MGQILHKGARTTQAIRKEIQQSTDSLRKLAKQYNLNLSTVAKWKKRETTEDSQMGNGRANSVLSPEEEILICETRKKTWMPLDDLFDLLKPQIPKLSRSNLHRCLKFYGISKVPEEFSNNNKVSSSGKFKQYEIGFIHIDITEFYLEKKKWYLFVAIDRITKLCIAEIHTDKTVQSSLTFLDTVITFFPYKIHRILTDNGLQFNYNSLPKSKQPKRKRHAFIQKCLDNGIKYKHTKFYSPQTNGQVERMNGIIKEATLNYFKYETIEQFKNHLNHFLNYYNLKKKQKAIGRLSPYDFTLQKYKTNPGLFYKNLEHYCLGLDT